MRLAVEDLRVGYGQELALAGVDLEVHSGETVGLLGPNGAGKSTLLNAIVGFVRPQSGKVELNGEPLIGKTPDSIARLGVSLVPEGRRIFAEMSVKENLLLGLTVHRGDTSPQGDLEEMLEHFPVLRRHYKTTAGKLSGGEQQQLAIARALLSRPELLLLDEPSLGLAPQYVDLVFAILEKLQKRGVTMLLVEQNVKRTIDFANRTYVLRAGRVELSGWRDELQAQDQLAEAYLGGAS